MRTIDSKDNLIRLLEQYKNLVFSLCLKVTGDYFVAEDITQETFIAAYTHFDEFDGNQEKAWICRIASNKCIDYKREAARRITYLPEEELPEESTDTRDNPLEVFINEETMQQFYNSCKSLPEPYGDVAEKHFIKGMTAREIADKTGNNLKTVQTWIYRAKEMLKKTIRKEELLT